LNNNAVIGKIPIKQDQAAPSLQVAPAPAPVEQASVASQD